MPDPTIGATGAYAPAPTTTTASALGGLDSDAFMQLMIAQMRYQDPMSPSDPSAMMQQTSVLAQTEMIQQLTQVQQQVLGLQQASMATDLVGTEVSALRSDGTTLTGEVEAVRFTATGPSLVINGEEVALQATSELRA